MWNDINNNNCVIGNQFKVLNEMGLLPSACASKAFPNHVFPFGCGHAAVAGTQPIG